MQVVSSAVKNVAGQGVRLCGAHEIKPKNSASRAGITSDNWRKAGFVEFYTAFTILCQHAHTGFTLKWFNYPMKVSISDPTRLAAQPAPLVSPPPEAPGFSVLLPVIFLLLLAFLLSVAAVCADAQPADSPALTNRVSITIEGEFRVIRANGLPDHEMGRFPNAHNPNSASAQHYVFRVPLHPQAAPKPTPVGMQNFGIAINGVPFDPAAAEWWQRDRSSGWQYEPMTGHLNLGVDENNAHVQPNGAYHYHGIPTGLVARMKNARSRMVLLGWAADGFPIYAPWGYSNANDPASPLEPLKSSFRLKQGARPSGPGGTYDGTFVADFEYVPGAGQLDDCNGRFGVTPDFPQGTYCYFLTTEFPFIPRFYKGSPDRSFERRGPPGGRPPGGPGGPGGRRPPPPPPN